MKNNLFFILMLLSLLAACQAQPFTVRPPLTEDGEAYIYIEPLPQQEEGLSFTVEGISAIAADGSEIPLTLLLSNLNSAGLKRQRLLAEGILPKGDYQGFSMRVAKASRRAESGEETSLAVPAKPVEMKLLFGVRKRKAIVVSLGLRGPAAAGPGFSPVFRLFTSGRPVSGVAGFVSNYGSNDITVFDKSSKKVMAVIVTGAGPKGSALDERRRRLYVALSGEDAIEVIDSVTLDPLQKIRLNTGDNPRELVLAQDGALLLAVNEGSNTVSFIDPINYLEVKRVVVGNSPDSILLDRNGRRAYVFNNLSNSVSVIDIAGRTVAGSFSTEPGPLRGQFNRKGDRLYIINGLSPFMSVVDPGTFSLLNRISVGSGVASIKVDTVTDQIYLGRSDGATIDIYDPFSFLPFDFMTAEDGARYMTIDGQENNLLVVGRKGLLFMNLVSKKTVSEIDTGEDPVWVSVAGER